MRSQFFLMGLLSIGLLASCQSKKQGGSGGALADNGGYSDGGFYGDSTDPAPHGYPQDGETFATHGGVPFGHNDRAETREPVLPTVAPVTPVVPVAARPAPPPQPVSISRVVATPQTSPDPYGEAYADGSGYGGDHGAEAAVVTPYVDRVATASTPSTSKPKTTAGSTATRTSDSKKAVVSTPKKKTPVVASSTRAAKAGGSKASGKKTGTTVKAVYKPPGKSAAKKMATVARVHDVKRGDTLSKLSGRYGVSVAHLKKRNKLTSDTIVVGKRLTVD